MNITEKIKFNDYCINGIDSIEQEGIVCFESPLTYVDDHISEHDQRNICRIIADVAATYHAHAFNVFIRDMGRDIRTTLFPINKSKYSYRAIKSDIIGAELSYEVHIPRGLFRETVYFATCEFKPSKHMSRSSYVAILNEIWKSQNPKINLNIPKMLGV